MIVAVADTHAVIWYLAADPRISTVAKLFMDSTANDGDEIAVSAITLVEMVYLIEKGRIPAQYFSNLAGELNDPDSMFVEVPIDLKIARAVSRVDVDQFLTCQIVSLSPPLFITVFQSSVGMGKLNFPASKQFGRDIHLIVYRAVTVVRLVL